MAATLEKPLETVDDVIDALGGNTAVMDITAVRSPQAVSNWRYRQRIPSRHYSTMVDALARLHRDAPSSLWGMSRPEAPSA